jgi:hypothetical protein
MLLQVGAINHFAHFTAQGIRFMGELRFGRATDGWVTGLPCNFV